jgi:hypothetical protein
LEGSRNGWFNRFKHGAGFHNVKVCGKVASADIAAAERFCDVLEKKLCFYKTGCSTQQIRNFDEDCCVLEKRPHRTCIGKQERTMPGFKASKDWATLLLGGQSTER